MLERGDLDLLVTWEGAAGSAGYPARCVATSLSASRAFGTSASGHLRRTADFLSFGDGLDEAYMGGATVRGIAAHVR